MNILLSNLPPLRTDFPKFIEKFDELLSLSDKVYFASGYISADSIIELKRLIELNSKPKIELVIGMHYFDKFTRKEYNSSIDLYNYLSENNMGNVYLSTAFRYHGKVYVFEKDDKLIGGIVGSNNLSSITEPNRIYETSYFIDDQKQITDLSLFIKKLINTSKIINELKITEFKENPDILLGQEGAKPIDPKKVKRIPKTGLLFQIPLKAGKDQTKSNLNPFFGKGRVDRRGLIKPRHWYEIEVIVPKEITSLREYPKSEDGTNVFRAVTDDGWTFKCKVSGDNNKNFRSEGDLKILGRWIKGRLENAGALKVGELVTEETLRKYGRDNFDLIKTKKENLWYLNFGV